MPRLSIITPLHNKAAYIGETIRSVLAQTLADWEMIVVENGSTDGGPEVVRQFADARIRLAVSPKNGPGTARNYGLKTTTGEWILFLDADDLLEPDYLSARLATAALAPGAKIIAGPWKEFAHDNRQNESLRYPACWRQDAEALEAVAFAYAPWVVHAAVVRREQVLAGPLWNESLDHLPSEDCAFWFPVIRGASVAWSEHAGALYRRNISCSRDDKVKSVSTGFAACVGTIQSNLNYLKRQNQLPTPAQAATVVRVLRRMLATARPANAEACPQIRREISRWLKGTSFLDPRMLVWRLKSGEFRRWEA